MNKARIAIAVLGLFSGAAFAQSSVTIYGKIDTGLVVDSGTGAGSSIRLSSGVSAGSRLGFKGIEDIGNGVKVGFQIETGFCSDSAAGAPNFCTGSNQFMGRQARGDLIGQWGTLSAGRVYSLGYLGLTAIDPFQTGLAGQVNNLMDGSGTRINNAIRYTTPAFSGLSATADVALGETTGDFRANREIGGSLNYAKGPAYASLVYYGLDNANGEGTAKRNIQLGGVYDFNVVKVHLLAQKTNGDPTNKPSIDSLDLMAGVTVPLAGGSVLASYVHHDDKTISNKDASQLGVGYVYPLSKLTSIYTAYARIRNDNGAEFTVGNATEDGVGDKSFNLGVVHNF